MGSNPVSLTIKSTGQPLSAARFFPLRDCLSDSPISVFLLEPFLAVVQPHSGAKYLSRLTDPDTIAADFSGKEIDAVKIFKVYRLTERKTRVGYVYFAVTVDVSQNNNLDSLTVKHNLHADSHMRIISPQLLIKNSQKHNAVYC